LKKLAKHFNLNYSYLCELFKREIGMSFSEYLTKIRIKRAKKLLRDKSLLIKQISYKVGYRHISNFNHDFKKQTGLSPLEYRRKWQKFIFKLYQSLEIKIRKITNSIRKYTKRIRKFTK
ncbi:helix-turn-helix transcriptional regulator, partial [SCandidatus Aminicenantes bacterium Aminicenantia_JdfR_composite]|nr:helix-turn-helix transcriptional regulator [SCandidatus Aminicenantes bacterium Aminicenantia_JdfR_composite]